MIYVIDLLIWTCIGLFHISGLSPKWEAILLLTHFLLLIIARLMYDNQIDKIEKNTNTINEHLERHRSNDKEGERKE